VVYNPNKFPTRPERQDIPPLSFAELSPDTWNALAELPRAGWVKRGVENPESVQEHIIALRRVASTLADIPEADMRDLLDMLEVHDWPEAIHGDEIIAGAVPEERQKLEEAKFEKEQQALVSICEGLGPAGQRIVELWLRFEKGEDEIASLARQLDKFQAVAKALEYEKASGKLIFLDFYTYAQNHVTHPQLVDRMEKLKEEWGMHNENND